MIIGKRDFKMGSRTFIMGILNITPDSFSDGGSYISLDAAMDRVNDMLNEGADIIDVGGESTRPGHVQISEEEEKTRVIPVISEIKKRFPYAVVSVDTYKPGVLRAAAEAGCDMVNDIWGFKSSPEMAEITAQYCLPCCLMHNRDNMDYSDFIEDIILDLKQSVAIALKAGVDRRGIIIDPGIGFAKTYEQNLEVLKNLDRIREGVGYPMLLGTSRKSVIGKALGGVEADERLEGTLATTVLGITKGCDIVRVHDVAENKRAAVMVDTVFGRR